MIHILIVFAAMLYETTVMFIQELYKLDPFHRVMRMLIPLPAASHPQGDIVPGYLPNTFQENQLYFLLPLRQLALG